MTERSSVIEILGRLLSLSTGSKNCVLASPLQAVINSLLFGEFTRDFLSYYEIILAFVIEFLVNNSKKPFRLEFICRCPKLCLVTWKTMDLIIQNFSLFLP